MNEPVVLGDWLAILTRLAAAGALGAVIGVDREVRNKPAGLRTHALVAVGAALFTIAGLNVAVLVDGQSDPNAVSRVIQGVVTGIGFLGGGVILRSEREQTVRGLTTAAGIWIVSAVGVACGAGLLRLAVIGTVLSILMLVVGGWLERLIGTAAER